MMFAYMSGMHSLISQFIGFIHGVHDQEYKC